MDYINTAKKVVAADYPGTTPAGWNVDFDDLVSSSNQQDCVAMLDSTCPLKAHAVTDGDVSHPPIGWRVVGLSNGDRIADVWVDLVSQKAWHVEKCTGLGMQAVKPDVEIVRASSGGLLVVLAGAGLLLYWLFKKK